MADFHFHGGFDTNGCKTFKLENFEMKLPNNDH